MTVHQIVVLFMGLHVLPKFDTAVRLVVDVFSSHDGTCAERTGDAVLVWKGIEPKNAQEYHFNDHFRGIS